MLAPVGAREADIDAAIDMLYVEESELTLTEPALPQPQAPRTARARREPRVKADSLAARMAAEDVYVREDLRRIAVVSAILFALLGLAWLVFVFLDVFGLY